MLLLSRVALFYFFCFHTRHGAMWEILAHRFIIISKPTVPNQTTGKRICANLVFMSPWLKHLQSCDMNRLSRAEMKLGTYVSVLCVAALLCLNACLCLQVFVGMCVCVCVRPCVPVCARALKWVRMIRSRICESQL